MLMTDELLGYDALSLGELIRKGEITPTELLEITLRRIERVNPTLNAVIHTMDDHAREVARTTAFGAPFHGVPFLLKDLVAEYQGTPLHEGSRALRGYISRIDTALVTRQKAAGLLIIGKTNTPEFGTVPTTEPALSGATANPWDLTLTPGGSSGGSAAAVAAGIVPMAHANDVGGSIRIPAACCGVFGFKPTRGRNPLGPLFGDLFSGLFCEHAVTRTVRDSAALLDATCGPSLGDPYPAPPQASPFLEEVGKEVGPRKIGLLTQVPEGWGEGVQVHPDCVHAAQDAARLCESLGHIVEEIAPAALHYPGLSRDFALIWSCGIGHMVAYWEHELGKTLTEDQLEPSTWLAYQAGLKRTGKDYLAALERIQRFSRHLARWYREGAYDLLLSPTLGLPPTTLGSFTPVAGDPLRWARLSRAFVAFTFVANLTGQPAMSVPLWWNAQGIPIGVQFTGRFGDEATLFRLGAQLEQARPWSVRTPPIHS
ncbi:MAG: amidase [Nitrospinae bacterium]|nr:amidase [Nitrospinota bacterium]